MTEKLLKRVRQETIFQLFTIYTRYLIGGAFVLAAFGMRKIFPGDLPHDETSYPLHSIPHLFQTLRHSGSFYQFIGWSQVFAGFLLMTQLFSRLGAVIYFPIVLNIFVITVSYNFGLTSVVTGLMLLATLYLLLWDFDTLKSVVFDSAYSGNQPELRDDRKNPFWVWTGLIMFISLIVLSFWTKKPILIFLIWFIEALISFTVYHLMRLALNKSQPPTMMQTKAG